MRGAIKFVAMSNSTQMTEAEYRQLLTSKEICARIHRGKTYLWSAKNWKPDPYKMRYGNGKRDTLESFLEWHERNKDFTSTKFVRNGKHK